MRMFLLFVAFVVFYLWHTRPLHVRVWELHPSPSESAKMANQAFCSGKPKCIAVFVAPWCPHCRNCVSGIQQLSKELVSNPSIGLSVVAASDQKPALEKLAMEFGSAGFVDGDGKTSKAFKVRGFPDWVLVDDHGKVEKRFSGEPVPCNPANIRQQLGLLN